MTKKNEPELISFSPEYTDVFMQAVQNASNRTMIHNESIYKRDDRTIEIYDTRAIYLLAVGEEYQKLVDQKK